MDETLNLKMVLSLRDKATKKLQKFNRELLKTQKLMRETGKLNLSTSKGSGSKGGGGGSGVGGALAGAGALGAGSAVAGGIASGVGAGSKAVRVLITALAEVQKQIQSVDQHILGLSTNITSFAQHMNDGASASEALNKTLKEDHFENAADAVDKYGNRVDKSAKSLKKHIKQQNRSEKATKKQTKSVNQLTGAYGKLKGVIATYLGANLIGKIVEMGAQYKI